MHKGIVFPLTLALVDALLLALPATAVEGSATQPILMAGAGAGTGDKGMFSPIEEHSGSVIQLAQARSCSWHLTNVCYPWCDKNRRQTQQRYNGCRLDCDGRHAACKVTGKFRGWPGTFLKR